MIKEGLPTSVVVIERPHRKTALLTVPAVFFNKKKCENKMLEYTKLVVLMDQFALIGIFTVLLLEKKIVLNSCIPWWPWIVQRPL